MGELNVPSQCELCDGSPAIVVEAWSVELCGDCIPDYARSAVIAEWGKAGGTKGGPARARNLTPERRTAIARLAANTRWSRTVPPGGG